ncbi:hypothetical protein [Roseovarius phycicola]|uniref:Uncharacterized protein n=1 Tax=Roseovarius phycicola TaxID=3080976 RepID=A0ABZ2HJK9_9RHOB
MTGSNAQGRTDAGHDLFKGTTKKRKDKASKKDTPPPIQVGEHGRYQIKSGLLAGKFVARAFSKPPTKARGMIAEATGETEEAAITALHSAIDAREVRRNEDRRKDPRTGTLVPCTDEYVEAFNSVNLTRPQRAMLMALSLAEDNGLAEEKVADAGSYKSANSAKKALASAGRMIAGYLSSKTGSKMPSKSLDGTALIGFCGDSGQEDKPGNWILHPELCAAIRIAT